MPLISRNSSIAESTYELARDGRLYCAYLTLTGMVAFGTNTGTGGPLIWNNTGQASGLTGGPRVMAVLLGLSVGWTTAPAAAGTVGLTWGLSTAPTSTSTTGLLVQPTRPDAPQGAVPQCNVYATGTPSAAGTTFLPIVQVGATDTDVTEVYVPLDGLIQIPPGYFASVAAAATISSMVGKIGLVFAEVPF